MRSSLYTGKVMHARSKPVPHKFAYPVYFYRFDLDEIDRLSREVMFFGYNRFCPVALYDKDYLRPGKEPLREKLEKILKEAGREGELGRVDLVTSARVMHYVFNPVSFFFCFDPRGDLDCVVVQVNNTFGEMHVYVLTQPLAPRRSGETHYQTDKVFHVSPFFERIGTYDFYFTDPAGDDLDIIIQHREGQDVVFSARLTGEPQQLGKWTVAAKLMSHPLMATLTMPRIVWQAAKLRYIKRLPVFTKPSPASPMTIRSAPPRVLGRLGRILARSFLKKIASGELTVQYPDGHLECFGEKGGKKAALRIADNAFFRRTIFRGDIGLGESYMAGEWSTGDLPGTLALLAENLDYLKEKHHRLSILGRTFDYTRHTLRPNTLTGSRRNISSHYDMSNEFFSIFLDPTMTYSCGLYSRPDSSLEEAQQNKLRTIINKACITEDDHVLEIGCGWGSFAMEAVRTTGCRVTGITISSEQLKYAKEKVMAAGMEEKIDLIMLDYRQLEGSYDKIVSIEMLEAVGHANLGNWFRVCANVLKPGGRALVQVITIPHVRYGYYTRSSDWIRKHIFPGGHLPSLEVLEDAAKKNTDFVFIDVEKIGSHYARTLRDWSRNLADNHQQALAQGFDETFLRKWHYYFSYCQAGFETGAIDDLQIVMDKPEPGKQP